MNRVLDVMVRQFIHADMRPLILWGLLCLCAGIALALLGMDILMALNWSLWIIVYPGCFIFIVGMLCGGMALCFDKGSKLFEFGYFVLDKCVMAMAFLCVGWSSEMIGLLMTYWIVATLKMSYIQ